MLQTTLRALSGAVCCIDPNHHESLLFAVRFYLLWRVWDFKFFLHEGWLILVESLFRFQEWASGIMERRLWMHCWNSLFLWYMIFFCHRRIFCNSRTNYQILLSLMLVYLCAGCFQWEIHWLVFGDACETFCAPFLPYWFSEQWEWNWQEKQSSVSGACSFERDSWFGASCPIATMSNSCPEYAQCLQ